MDLVVDLEINASMMIDLVKMVIMIAGEVSKETSDAGVNHCLGN